MAALSREELLTIRRQADALEEFLGMRKSFNFLGNADKVSNQVSGNSNEIEGFVNVVEKGRKALEGERRKMDSFFKGVGRSIPLIEALAQTLKKNNKELDQAIKDQSDTHKKAASAMDSYVKRVGVNSKKVADLNALLDKAETAANNLQSKIEKRAASEQKISNITKEVLDSEIKIKKDFSNLSVAFNEINTAIENTKKQIKNEARKKSPDQEKSNKLQEDLQKLNEALAHLETLSEIPKSTKELRDTIKGIDFSQVEDEKLREVLEDLKNDSSKNNQTVVSRLGEVKDRISGMHTGLTSAVSTQTTKMAQISDKLNRSLEQLGHALVAGMVEAGRKELSMVQTRQMRAGGQFQQIIPAATMGMSESDLLRVQDEQRFLIRRLGLAEGEEGGASEFISSGRFRDIQELGKELGLVGVEAAEQVLKISESLRVVGINATESALKNTIRFIKESHKEFGVTQEQMVGHFKEMTEGGLMALRFTGSEAEVREAMQDEVESRMRLARVLNQEIEIQEKRTRQMSDLLMGDPAETFKKSIGTSILASQMGFSQEEADLLQRYIAQENLGEDTKRAASLYERLRRTSATERAGTITGGNIFGAVVPHRLMDLAGIDVREASQEAARFNAADPMAAVSREGTNELHDFARAVMRARELLNGLSQSSLGLLFGSALASAIQLANVAITASLASRSLGILGAAGAGGGALKALKRGAGKLKSGGRLLGPVAAAGIGASALYNIYGELSGRGEEGGQQAQELNAERLREAGYSEEQIKSIGAGQEQERGLSLDQKANITDEAIGAGSRIGGMIAGAKMGAAVGFLGGGPLGSLIAGTAGLIGGGLLGDTISSTINQGREDRHWRDYISEKAGPENFDPQMYVGTETNRTQNGVTRDDFVRLVTTIDGEQIARHATGEDARQLKSAHGAVKHAIRHGGSEEEINQAKETLRNLQRSHFSDKLGDTSNMDLFGLLNTIEENRRNISLSGGPRGGGGEYITQANQNVGSLVDMLSNLDAVELTSKFSEVKEVEAVIRTLEGHHSQSDEMSELIERLKESMEKVEDNTGRTAVAGERSLNKQEILLSQAQQSYWQNKQTGIENAVTQLQQEYAAPT